MSDRVINLGRRGLRGETFADVLRRTGQYGVLPTDTDAEAISKVNAAAEDAADRAEDARDSAAAIGNYFDSLAAGEAGTTDGEFFSYGSGGEIIYRQRTSGGSVEVGRAATKAGVDAASALAASKLAAADLALATGSSLVGHTRTGTGAATTTAQARLRELNISVTEFGAVAGAADNTAAIRNAIANLGSTVETGTRVTIFFPDGTWNVDYLPGQAVRFLGQSRRGTIVKARNNGSEALIDARRNRGTLAANTQGNLWVENLSVDGNGFNRNCITAYGGSCVIQDVDAYGSASVGINLQYVLKTRVMNVTSRNNTYDGLFIDVDTPLHTGDVSTSVLCMNVWCHDNGRYGFNATNINYCAFINCTSQANGDNGWNLDGEQYGAGVDASIALISCASEGDLGRSFNFKRIRNLTMLNPFLLAAAGQHAVYCDDVTGTIIGLTDSQVHTGGTYGLVNVNQNGGAGSLITVGGVFTSDAATITGLSVVGSAINGVAFAGAPSFYALGTKVLGTQGVAVGDLAVDATSADIINTVNALLARLRASTGHGLIAG